MCVNEYTHICVYCVVVYVCMHNMHVHIKTHIHKATFCV